MTEYIDKKKVIDIINITCPDFNIPEINDSWAHKLIVIIREALVSLVEKEPAADVRENVKGKWELTESGDARCSRCGHVTSERLVTWDVIHGGELAVGDITMGVGTPIITASKPFFCSTCGADMRGGKDG